MPRARVATTRLVEIGIRAMHAVAMDACLLVTSSSKVHFLKDSRML